MNFDHDGKKIARIDFVDGPSGNPHFCESGPPERAPYHGFYHRGFMHFSITNHGDHDELWVVITDADGKELARRAARACDHIVWLADQS